MSVYKLSVTKEALQDFEDSATYYEKQLQGLGFDFEQEIASILEDIELNPYLFPAKLGAIREAVVIKFPFVINYLVDANKVVVINIFHTKQNPQKKAKRK